MAQLQVKCYLLKNDSKLNKKAIEKATEIRRFNIENNDNGLYSNLLDKIFTYFKDEFKNKNEIKTYYIDDEDEFIGFSSESEFQYGIDVNLALAMSKLQYNASQNVFKIYVVKSSKDNDNASSSTSGDENENQEILHHGVVCDGCSGSVKGTRYKCTTCPDYDLCSSCESKGIHKETNHKLTKIEFPRFFRPRCGRFSKHGEHKHHHHYHKHAKKLFGDMFTNLQSSFNTKLNDAEGLKKFGDYLKGVLGPFGVDVDYYVDSVTKKNETPKTEEATNSEPTKMETESETKKTSLIINDPNKSSSVSIIIENNDEKNKESIKTTTSTTTSTTSSHTASNTNNASAAAAAATASAPNLSLPKPNEDLDGFNLVEMDKEIKILKAVEQLKEMGFTDENNWLTSLVTSKDGNINAVLDALSPFLFKN